MNNKFLITTGVALALLSCAPLAAAQEATGAVARPVLTGPVRAMRMASSSAARGAAQANAIAKAESAAATEIGNREKSLNALLARVGQMVHLTAGEKSSITATINGEVAELQSLGTQIASAATTTLKADVQSITKDYRIYALVEPQITILAAADRAASIGDMLTTLAGKIEPRLAATPNAAASALLADLQAKVADANTQSSAAIAETASLAPDNGDTTIQASNTAALKDARSKIQTAQADLKGAYQDAANIVKALKGSASVTASTSPSVQ
jgi:hypothetical protein